MILEAIFTLTGVAAVASIINLFDNKRYKRTATMKVELPGNLPIISLINKKGKSMNFLVDSGSNISHICSEYYESLDAELIDVFENEKVEGLGATNVGVTMCKVNMTDESGYKYTINLSVSEQLSQVSKSIELSTGTKIHGLLGTDFLRKYKYVLDFKEHKLYSYKS